MISNDNIEYNQRSSHEIPTCSHWFVYTRNHIMPDQFDQSSFVFWWLQHIVATYCIHWGNFHPMFIKTPGYVAALLPRAPAISKSSPTCVNPNDSNHPFIFSPQSWRFPKSWGYPKSPKLDHDFVFKPMATWGSPILRNPYIKHKKLTKLPKQAVFNGQAFLRPPPRGSSEKLSRASLRSARPQRAKDSIHHNASKNK